MTITAAPEERERQRFEHLVLGRARPHPEQPPAPPRKRKGRRLARVAPAAPAALRLEPGIEEAVALRERWSHKAGTPETLEKVERAQQRPGSIARLYASGTLDQDQLAAAQAIAEAYRACTADVAVRTASLETRVDGGGHGRAEEERLGRVRAAVAYDWWRDAVGGCAASLLEVIAHDVGLTIVAREGGLSMPRARRMLTDALDLWPVARRRAREATTPPAQK